MTFNKDLDLGSFGLDVLNLQMLLEHLGFGDFLPTGIFGLKTYNAVKNLQHYFGLDQVGRLGPLTRARLNVLTNREVLLICAQQHLGSDASPNDVAPDEYACAETVNDIHQYAFGFQIGGTVSTALLYSALNVSKYFTRVDNPLPGDIIISPTGYGNGVLPNGHVGIVGPGNTIMSNTSANGKFLSNYTLSTWSVRYKQTGGYPVIFFRRV